MRTASNWAAPAARSNSDALRRRQHDVTDHVIQRRAGHHRTDRQGEELFRPVHDPVGQPRARRGGYRRVPARGPPDSVPERRARAALDRPESSSGRAVRDASRKLLFCNAVAATEQVIGVLPVDDLLAVELLEASQPSEVGLGNRWQAGVHGPLEHREVGCRMSDELRANRKNSSGAPG